jgi:hypothetical protein
MVGINAKIRYKAQGTRGRFKGQGTRDKAQELTTEEFGLLA